MWTWETSLRILSNTSLKFDSVIASIALFLFSPHSLFCSLIHQVFIECLLYARYCSRSWDISFLKNIFYWLCYYSCPNISPFALLHPAAPSPLGHPPTIVHGHGSCAWVLWLLTSPWLFCNCTYLYFLIPSPLHPLSHMPSHPATIKTLSVSTILSLFCLFA